MMYLNQNFARAIHFSAYGLFYYPWCGQIDKYIIIILYFDTIDFERSSRLSGKSWKLTNNYYFIVEIGMAAKVQFTLQVWRTLWEWLVTIHPITTPACYTEHITLLNLDLCLKAWSTHTQQESKVQRTTRARIILLNPTSYLQTSIINNVVITLSYFTEMRNFPYHWIPC